MIHHHPSPRSAEHESAPSRLSPASSQIIRPAITAAAAADARRQLLCGVTKKSRNKRQTVEQLIWSLVIFSLIQLTANIILSSFNQPESQSLHIRHDPYHYQHRQHHPSCNSIPVASPSGNDHVGSPGFEAQNDKNSRNPIDRIRYLQQLESSSSCSSEATSTISAIRRPSTPASSLTLTPENGGQPTHLAGLRAFAIKLSQTILNYSPKIITYAQAASNGLYPSEPERDIIVLNSTNFNPELIQYNHPFPHIKLIEYYLPYCGVCLKFKATYLQLAREIHPWRNVIRPSQINLGVSSNAPIVQSWSIDVVPTLRIHPPLSPSLSRHLHQQLTAWTTTKTSSELQKLMFDEYSGANLSISSLGVIKYTTELSAKRELLLDKVAALKLDLLGYIERYVREHPNELPSTWPNLRPVAETTLEDLRKNHPRQELFLIVETGASSSDASGAQPSYLGLSMMMELSSSAAWKAVRYVRASENRALIEDVIAKKKMEQQSSDQTTASDGGGSINAEEQVKLLIDALDGSGNNNILLIHIDNSHPPQGQTQASKFPFVTIVTGSNLVTVERSAQIHQQQQQHQNQLLSARSKRGTGIQRETNLNGYHNSIGQPTRQLVRTVRSSDLDLQRKIQLIMLYVNHTYTETKEDRLFVEALRSLDEDPASFAVRRAEIDRFQQAADDENKNNQFSNDQLSTASGTTNQANQKNTKASEQGKLANFIKSLNPFDTSSKSSLFFTSSGDNAQADDYEDKLKALRYMFFNEIPRKSLIDRSLIEKQEKLDTIANLVAVIRTYFPFPDEPSRQFFDAVRDYLARQQAMLSSINSQDRATAGEIGFDTLAFKQELKRIEAEGKRLPEIKEWKHCKFGGGYSCALWRLFHTLTAVEYEKLNQMYQNKQHLSTGLQGSQVSPHLFSELNHSSTAEPQVSGSQQQQQAQDTAVAPSPVERLVSPPSTTTSLSLTIATPTSSNKNQRFDNNGNNDTTGSEADLPYKVLLVMRDYITNFYGCEDCVKNFRQETMGLSLEKIRQQPADFSILWLWDTHNRISKRLSVDPQLNSNTHPRDWFPNYEQCPSCYRKPPSFLGDTSIEPSAIFRESIEWNREEILNYLLKEYLPKPMNNNGAHIFGYQISCGIVVVIGISSLLLIVLLRCASCYIERQRRHKATLLNGNGAHYSVELQ